MARKFIYGEQFTQKLPGDDQDFYFRTVTSYEVDSNGKPIEGSAKTNLYYAPKPAARTSDGKTWTAGTADSASTFDQGGWVLAGFTDDKGKTYSFKKYTQEDADLGRLPPGKNVGDEVLGDVAKQSFSTSGGKFYDAVQNNLINLAVKTQPNLAKTVSAKQQNIEDAANSGGGTDDDDSLTQVSGLAPINNVKPKERGTLIYPLGIDKNGQDYIKFRGIEYIPQAAGSSSYVLERPIEQTQNIKPIVTIILPIQPTIMDTNTVSWGEEKFGILEMIGSGISLDAMNGATIDEMINKFGQTITTNGGISAEIVAGIKASLAQKAVGSNNNLLSRLTGAVTNPNLTLLFNSPDLRNFSFNFKLSPRSKKEGTVVRQIIRSFKELMAVQRTAGNLFLEAPCVFEVEYIRGRDKLNEVDGLIHPSLNRIKTCALRSFSVNYTPSGSYMAYNDKEGTMTSYDLTMSFTELDPIYFDDYSDPETGTDKIPFDQIGY